jgi:hypothetical protein
MFRVAVARGGLGWSPAEFWSATLVEFEMALQAMRGEFKPGPFISRERVAEIARAWGLRKSIRT